jgi:hypothetical protein
VLHNVHGFSYFIFRPEYKSQIAFLSDTVNLKGAICHKKIQVFFSFIFRPEYEWRKMLMVFFCFSI